MCIRDREKVYALSDTYRQFLDNGKTERECVVQAVEFAEAKGYVNLKDIIKSNTPIKAGDKMCIRDSYYISKRLYQVKCGNVRWPH